MPEFRCNNCGKRIKVPEGSAGKKGRCPKCNNIIIVPENDVLRLRHGHTDGLEDIQQQELHLKRDDLPVGEKFEGLSADGLNVTNEALATFQNKEEKPAGRKLPLIIDIFLYPNSVSGLINLGIFWLLPIIFAVVQRILPLQFIFTIADFIVLAYMCYFLVECIRDSALGGIRAPESITSVPDTGEAVAKMLELIASVVIFWGPLGGYLLYKTFGSMRTHSGYDPAADIFVWFLLGYGVFFFPIGILAIAMFNSSSAFNPLLWVTSILSTFFQYCGMVLLFTILAILFSGMQFFFQGSVFFMYLYRAVFIYLAMVLSHLLGRFYYRNKEKLNWDV